MFFRGWLSGLLMLAATACYGQEIDVDAVRRRGDWVEHVAGYQDNGSAIGDALAPPEDDDHKWHITVLKQNGCAPCNKLLADFRSNPALEPWVRLRPGELVASKESWAKFNVYSKEDTSQAYHFKGIKIKGYPTLIVQPPMTGKFGPPTTVVIQKTGYNGDAAALTRELRDGIIRYVERFREKSRQAEKAQEIKPEQVWGQHGVDPPFITPPKDDPSDDVPDHDIPDAVNPDKPAPDAQPQGLPRTPTAFVLREAQVKAGARIEKFLVNARERLSGLVETVLSFDEAKKIFPNLNQNSPPAVIVVDEGKVLEQVTVDNLPPDLMQLIGEILAVVMSLAGGNPVSWIAIGVIGLKVFQLFQSWRFSKGEKLYIPAEFVAAAKEYLESLKKDKEKAPTQ